MDGKDTPASTDEDRNGGGLPCDLSSTIAGAVGPMLSHTLNKEIAMRIGGGDVE